MRKHFYVLEGLSLELIYALSDNMRSDITLVEEDGMYRPYMELTWVEAFKMKYDILCCNMKDQNHFALKRIA